MTKIFSSKIYSIEEIQGNQCIIHPGAATILPFLDKKNILLLNNKRVCVGQTIWELPAGTVEKGEDPKTCALRELQEETGYRASRLTYLTSFYSSPGISNEKIWAFQASDLDFIGQKLNEDEEIKVEIFPWKKVIDMVENQEIIDGKTLLTLLYFLHIQKVS